MKAVFFRVLDMSLTGSVVILAVLCARCLLKRAPKVLSYALWAAVLFRLLCPVSLTAPVSVLTPVKPTVSAASEVLSSVSYLPWSLPETSVPVEEPTAGTFQIQTVLPEEKTPDHRAVVAWVWCLGVWIMAFRGLLGYLRLRRKLLGAAPCQEGIYLADHIPTPFVMGIWKPKIYLPSDTPEEERVFILAHERCHIRRFDHITRILAYGALCVHWFNPLVWLAFLLAGKDMEMSCDEAVIRELGPQIRAEYAQSLLRLATGRSGMVGMPLAFGQGDTKGRVKHMAKWKKPGIWVVTVSVLLCIAVVLLCTMNPQGEKVEPTVPPTVQTTELPQATEAVVSDENAALQKCRAALENIVSLETCTIKLQRNNYGGPVLNDTSKGEYYQDGENWLMFNFVPDEGFQRGFGQFGHLYVDGNFYDNMRTGWDEEENIRWGEGEVNPLVKPWITRFHWDAQEVRFVSSVPAGEGECVTLQVMAPYQEGSEDIYDNYQMQIFFNEKGAVERVENTYFFHDAQEGDYSTRETLQWLDGQPAAVIGMEYERYLGK